MKRKPAWVRGAVERAERRLRGEDPHDDTPSSARRVKCFECGHPIKPNTAMVTCHDAMRVCDGEKFHTDCFVAFKTREMALAAWAPPEPELAR